MNDDNDYLFKYLDIIESINEANVSMIDKESLMNQLSFDIDYLKLKYNLVIIEKENHSKIGDE